MQEQKTPIHARTHLSINQSLNAQKETVKQEEEKLAQISANQPFDQMQLISCWNKYIRTIPDEKQVLKNTMELCKPTLEADYTLKQLVDNSFQEEEMKKERIDLLNFLRIELKNGKIDLVIKINDTPAVERILTPTMRLEKILENNPSLKRFKEKYKLELK